MNALQAFFEDLAARWDAQQPENRQEVLAELLRPFSKTLRNARAILDVGTGTGMLIPCLKHYAPHARVVSIDLAIAMLRQAQRRVAGARLVQADVQHLPFAARAEIFDVIVCHNSFPHFAEMTLALQEMKRILTPGGNLLILHDLSRERVNAIHSSAGGAIEHDLLPPGTEMQQMLETAGFSDVWVKDSPSNYLATGQTPLIKTGAMHP